MITLFGALHRYWVCNVFFFFFELCCDISELCSSWYLLRASSWSFWHLLYSSYVCFISNEYVQRKSIPARLALAWNVGFSWDFAAAQTTNTRWYRQGTLCKRTKVLDSYVQYICMSSNRHRIIIKVRHRCELRRTSKKKNTYRDLRTEIGELKGRNNNKTGLEVEVEQEIIGNRIEIKDEPCEVKNVSFY
jgi:hypothetical protein